MKQLGFEPARTWDIGTTGGNFTLYTTAWIPVLLLLPRVLCAPHSVFPLHSWPLTMLSNTGLPRPLLFTGEFAGGSDFFFFYGHHLNAYYNRQLDEALLLP